MLDNDVPALLVAATGDPRTPYAGAETVREQWPGSRLLTVAGARQHGLYDEYGDACVDERVNAYLRTGRLPAHDVACATRTDHRQHGALFQGPGVQDGRATVREGSFVRPPGPFIPSHSPALPQPPPSPPPPSPPPHTPAYPQ